MKMSKLDWITFILLLIGGLNWGLVGFFSYDLVASLFGATSMISRVIYGLVGLSALYALFTIKKH